MSSADLHKRLKDVISRLEDAALEYKQKNNLPNYFLKADPPAKIVEIKNLERVLKISLPPSYREFLLMHNGYAGLACPGSMLSIADMIPGAALYKKIEEWKTDSAGFDERVKDGIVFADQAQPNDWAYFDPNKKTENGEWTVVLNLGGDSFEFDDLIDFFESRIKFCKFNNE